MSIAIHAITANGHKLQQKLLSLLPQAQGFSSHGAVADGQASTEKGSFKASFSEQFNRFDCHLCLCSAGIVTRLLAPLLTDKRRDPAVICMDEQGQFVVPLLSGHRGGANAYALRIAELLGSQAVLTTASDAANTLSVDLLGAAFGWQLDPSCEQDIVAVSAAVVNQQPLLIEQHSGHRRWWPHQRSWPAHWITSPEQGDAKARVVISHQQQLTEFAGPTVVWRPKVLELGVGCDRGTPAAVIAAAISAFCQQNNLAEGAIHRINSISLKADEIGLIELSQQRGWAFECYSAEQLSDVEGVENPSETVKRCIGVSSVAEAASLYGAGVSTLLAPKFKFNGQGFNVTVAACLVPSPSQHKAETSKPSKPLKHFAYHLILCGGRHCVDGDGNKEMASKLRRLAATELGEQQRLKLTRSNCIGGCRMGLRATLYCRSNQQDPNHGVMLQHLEQLSFDQWRSLFAALAAKQPVTELLDSHHVAEVAPCQ